MSVSSLRPRLRRPRPLVALSLSLALSLAGALSLTSIATAKQGSAAGPTLFRGDSAKISGITLSGWGSGSVTEDTNAFYSGSESLKIVTQGPYQGASMTFDKPVDISAYLANKNAYLELTLLTNIRSGGGNFAGGRGGFAGGGRGGLAGGRGGGFPGGGGGFPGGGGGFPGGGGGFPGGGGGFPGGGGGFPGGGGGFPGGGGGGFPGGGGIAGGRGGRNGASFKVQKAQPLANIRLVLVTAGGKTNEVYLPLNTATRDNEWLLLHIPVPAIKGFTADDAQIKELQFFGDEPAILFLGQVRIVTDETPLTVQPIEEQVVPRNERYRYTASAAAGVMPLKYTWDFDESDGLQDEGEGRSVTHTYYKQGDFVATVTVSDYYGLKPAVTRKFKVHVTP